MIIIGLGHKKRRGKDTLAQFWMKARGKSVRIKRYAFADALKQEVSEAIVNIMINHNGGKPYTDAENFLVKIQRRIGREQRIVDRYLKNPQCAVELLCDWASVPYDPNPPMDPPMDDPLCPYGKQRALLQWWGSEYRRAQDPDYWVRKLEDTLIAERPGVDVAVITDMRFPNEFELVQYLGGIPIRLDRPGYPDDDTHQSETALNNFPFHYVISGSTVTELKTNGLALFDQIVMERLK
jgi:hypothetical protein